MKRVSRILSFLIVFFVFGLVGCSSETYRLDFYDGTGGDGSYSDTLFYRNDLEVAGADPGVIYVDDGGEYDGWFFMYPTSDEIGGHGISAYKSRDLKSWEYVGPAFLPEDGSWSRTNIYAPECIYDEETQKYYLFYSADDIFNVDGRGFTNNYEKEFYAECENEVNSILTSLTSASGFEKIYTQATTLLESVDDEIEQYKVFFALEDATKPYMEYNGFASTGKYDLYSQEEKDAALKEIDAFRVNEETTEKSIIELNPDNKKLSELDESDALRIATLKKELALNAADLLLSLKTAGIEVMRMNGTAEGGKISDWSIGVAISDSPAGPFVQYTNMPGETGYNDKNRDISLGLPFLSNEDVWYYFKEYNGGTDFDNDEKLIPMIDIHPFVDPASGDKYLYMVREQSGGGTGGGTTDKHVANFIIAIKLGDKNAHWTDDPIWESAKRLTRVGYYDLSDRSDANKTDLNEGHINEGPFVVYNKQTGKYLLTMSVSSYGLRTYSVAQAVGDTPLGPFRKLSLEEGGKILSSEIDWDHISGTGHHSFVNYGGEMFVLYHEHFNRAEGGGQRGIAVDRVVWVKNAKGETILHCNGPTYSLQPKIGPDAEYKDITSKATVTCNNTAEDSDVAYLTDNVVPLYSWDTFLNEFVTGKKKKTTITLDFGSYVAVRAIMVYNSRNYETHFDKIDRIEFDFKKSVNGAEVSGMGYMDDIRFDNDEYIIEIDEDIRIMRPGAAAFAEFWEMEVSCIRIIFESSDPIAVSEIRVLGK